MSKEDIGEKYNYKEANCCANCLHGYFSHFGWFACVNKAGESIPNAQQGGLCDNFSEEEDKQ